MLLARRKFIQKSLIFSATAFLLSETSPIAFARNLLNDGSIPDEALRNPLYSFTKETFEPYVGGYFEAVGARGQNVPLKLLKVESYSPKPETKICKGALETQTFSLQFRADTPLPTTKSIHQISHGALGDFDLFLTRRDPLGREYYYEAVFNRLR